MSQNLQNFVKFQKFQLENLVDFEKCCKTHILLQKSEPIQPKTSNILPKFCRNFVRNFVRVLHGAEPRDPSSRREPTASARRRRGRRAGGGRGVERLVPEAGGRDAQLRALSRHSKPALRCRLRADRSVLTSWIFSVGASSANFLEECCILENPEKNWLNLAEIQQNSGNICEHFAKNQQKIQQF